MLIKNCNIEIIHNDITELEIDAIVNAANNKLVMEDGVAGAIVRKGGESIEKEAVRKGPIEAGEALATTAGTLSAKYVIHAATMGMDFKTDESKIRNACRSALKIAQELNLSSIAFPALGCGVGGFPYLASAKIMAQEIFRIFRENENVPFKKIVFCLYDKEAYEIFNKIVFSYLEYISYKLQAGPFITVDAIIEINGGIVVIQRSNPPFGWALPGGFVDYGESLETAVKREALEETSLNIFDIKQFHTYSAPDRDPRFHTIGTVFTAKAQGTPRAGDDASGLRVMDLNEIKTVDFAFDHKKIIEDYLAYKQGESPF